MRTPKPPGIEQCSRCRKDKPIRDFHEAVAVGRNRKVTSRCKECRSDAYHERKYPDTICKQCLKHRSLDNNGICKKCNKDSGLRQCNGGCNEILPITLSYYDGRKSCNFCSKKKD